MTMQQATNISSLTGGHPERPTRLLLILTRFGLIFVWIVMGAIYEALQPSQFLTVATFKTVFGSQEPLVFLGLPLILTFTIGEFDLSVAGTLGLTGAAFAVLATTGLNVVVAAVVALAIGALIGFFNAFIIVILGVDAIITTLGMSTLLLGLSLAVTGGSAVSGVSQRFGDIANITWFGLPLTFYYGLGLAGLITYILLATPLGRHMTFVGANREVARLAGINVRRIRFGAYIASALICSVGGILLAASVGGFDPSTAQQYLLQAFAAVALGTIVIMPGRFNPLGTLVSIYFLVTGIVGLQLLGFTTWISQVFYGAALIIAVSISKVVREVMARGVLGAMRVRKTKTAREPG